MTTTATIMRHLRASWPGQLAAIAALALPACSSTARFGDPDGVPVAVTVTIDPGYFASAGHDPEHASSAPGGGQPPAGIGHLELLGCEAVGEGVVFRKDVGWGESAFAIPLQPGHQLDLALAVSGEHEARAALGAIAIPRQTPISIRIHLDRSGSAVAVSDGSGHIDERRAPVPALNAPSQSRRPTPPLDEPTVLPPPLRPLN